MFQRVNENINGRPGDRVSWPKRANSSDSYRNWMTPELQAHRPAAAGVICGISELIMKQAVLSLLLAIRQC